MKTLLLIRHAKSADPSFAQSDFQRTLHPRGIKDASAVASYLIDQHMIIDRFVSSPAVRAKSTAMLFMKAYNRNPEDLVLIEDLYQASATAFLKTVLDLDDKDDQVALFSHNPGISEFADSLTTTKIDGMPTSAVFAVSADITSWRGFNEGIRKFLFFRFPGALA